MSTLITKRMLLIAVEISENASSEDEQGAHGVHHFAMNTMMWGYALWSALRPGATSRTALAGPNSASNSVFNAKSTYTLLLSG